MNRPIVHHIPACPFSQRLEILLALKGHGAPVDFRIVDITRPRSPELLAKTRGSTALPVLETFEGRLLKESLVILRYLDEALAGPPIAAPDPYARAVENMLIAFEGEFAAAGYRFVMNQDRARRDAFAAAMDAQHARLDDFLLWQAPGRDFLGDGFGLAEAVFAPLFQRFWFLEYYEGYDIPPQLLRVRRWRDACLAHPAAQQVERERIVKLYHDYALGFGNGVLPPGRGVSSPWPPSDKWGPAATDAQLGLA
jgi:glutathione S-transferase